MPAPIIWALWIGGAAILAGGAGGTYAGARRMGEGLGEGLRVAVPLAVGATAIYYFLETQRK